MIIGILLTIWILAFCVMVAVDNTPCCDSLKKAFVLCSSFLVATMILTFIWMPYLSKGIQ